MKEPFTLTELKELARKVPVEELLNKRGKAYKARQAELEGLTEEALLEEMAKDPKLIRRPLLIKGDEVIVGFDADEYKRVLT
ncbi:hypothetical protein BSNK01_13640 [Bacillaceae bacterium]